MSLTPQYGINRMGTPNTQLGGGLRAGTLVNPFDSTYQPSYGISQGIDKTTWGQMTPAAQAEIVKGQSTINGLKTGSSGGLGALGNIASGVNALTGIANAYLGYKNFGLAEKQFGAEKAIANANYINSAKSYNNNLQNTYEIGAANQANLTAAGMTASMDPAQVAAMQDKINSRKFSTDKIV